METTWLIVLALALILLVIAVLFVRARAEAEKLRSELAVARSTSATEESALGAVQTQLEVARDEAIRLKEQVDHLKQGPVSPAPGTEAPSEQAGNSGASKTVIRQAAPLPEAPPPEPAPPAEEEEGARRTVLFRPPVVDEAEDSTTGQPYLKLLNDGVEDQLHYLNFGSTWAGRDQTNDIVVADDRASRRHFEILYTENRFQLRDNDSTNGTACNGSATQQAWLEFGDEIKVGDTKMVFSCEGYDAKDTAAPKAIAALEKCIQRQPEFIQALKLLAFLLERDIARRDEAVPLWDTIARLEK